MPEVWLFNQTFLKTQLNNTSSMVPNMLKKERKKKSNHRKSAACKIRIKNTTKISGYKREGDFVQLHQLLLPFTFSEDREGGNPRDPP
jgi:hypothetical protein